MTELARQPGKGPRACRSEKRDAPRSGDLSSDPSRDSRPDDGPVLSAQLGLFLPPDAMWVVWKRKMKFSTRLGVDDSTVSRMKSESVPRLARLLACCGLKVVREEYQCWPEDQIEATRVLANAYMQRTRHASDMAWEDPE